MKLDDFDALVDEMADRIDVDSAWAAMEQRVRAGRRKGRLMLAAPVVGVLSLVVGGVVLVWPGNQRQDISTVDSPVRPPAESSVADPDPQSTQASPSSSAPPTTPTTAQPSATTASPPPSIPEEATFGALLDAHGTTGESVTLPVAGLDGRELQFTMTPEAASLLRPLVVDTSAYITCEVTENCGTSEAAAIISPDPLGPNDKLLETLTAPDGGEVLLVDTQSLSGLVLRWFRSGWRLDVRLRMIPEGEYSVWVDGIQPVLLENGWMRLAPTELFRLSGPSGHPDGSMLSLYGGGAQAPVGSFQLIPAPGCGAEAEGESSGPRSDGSPNLSVGICFPEANVLVSLDGEPSAVRSIQSGLNIQ